MTESERISITAVIPAFNEEKTIGHIVRDARRHVSEVIVVDDGSDDATSRTAMAAGATVLRHSKNKGYGSALATGFAHFRSNGAGVLVVLDGDGQHNPNEIPLLVRPILDGMADIVTGSRFIDNGNGNDIPRYRKFGIGMVNRAWRFASKDAFSDTQCGFRAYSRDAVEKMDIRQADMSASLEILDRAADHNLKIVEVPVSVRYEGDTSTMKPGRHGMELVSYVLKKVKEEHPLLIFGGIGMGTTIVGLIAGVFALNSYFDSRYLPFGPTVIAAIAIYVGTLMIFGGLILNSIQSLATRLEEGRAK